MEVKADLVASIPSETDIQVKKMMRESSRQMEDIGGMLGLILDRVQALEERGASSKPLEEPEETDISLDGTEETSCQGHIGQ